MNFLIKLLMLKIQCCVFAILDNITSPINKNLVSNKSNVYLIDLVTLNIVLKNLTPKNISIQM